MCYYEMLGRNKYDFQGTISIKYVILISGSITIPVILVNSFFEYVEFIAQLQCRKETGQRRLRRDMNAERKIGTNADEYFIQGAKESAAQCF